MMLRKVRCFEDLRAEGKRGLCSSKIRAFDVTLTQVDVSGFGKSCCVVISGQEGPGSTIHQNSLIWSDDDMIAVHKPVSKAFFWRY